MRSLTTELSTNCTREPWCPEQPPPSWISENVNNSKLDRAIYNKFGGQMHHGHAEMTHDQKSKPTVNSCDIIKREHKCDDVKDYKSSQLTSLYFKPMQNSPVRAIVSVIDLSYLSYQQTLLKQQILYRKTAHSLSKVV